MAILNFVAATATSILWCPIPSYNGHEWHISISAANVHLLSWFTSAKPHAAGQPDVRARGIYIATTTMNEQTQAPLDHEPPQFGSAWL